MLEQKEHFHGSDLEKAEALYGIPKEDIISFAANVNPLGISPRLRRELPSHIDAICSYPDREYTSLRKAISRYVKTNYRHILVGNGTTELISLIIQKLRPAKSLIIGPTYSEYEHEVSIEGGRSRYFRLKEEEAFALNENALFDALTPDTDLLAICNPNNPTSGQISRAAMRQILDCCKERGIFVLVDETYVEFSESLDSITSIPLTESYNNIIVLRGISKFFAAPGLRLGYAVCGNEHLLGRLNELKNPWSINSLAAIAGEIMFEDRQYISDTLHLISSERKRICKLLDKHKDVIKYYTPHANFILLKLLNETATSEGLFEAAIRQGFMIRDCSSFPFLNNRYIRFCFMKPEQNDALLTVLLQNCKEQV